MPHLLANRPRLLDLTRDHADQKAQFRWEAVNAVLYKIGGIVSLQMASTPYRKGVME